MDGRYALDLPQRPRTRVHRWHLRAGLYLHAAEFALGPAFAHPGAVRLAPSEPLEVEAGHARLALSKGDCSLII